VSGPDGPKVLRNHEGRDLRFGWSRPRGSQPDVERYRSGAPALRPRPIPAGPRASPCEYRAASLAWTIAASSA